MKSIRSFFPSYSWRKKGWFTSFIWLAILLIVIDFVSKWIVELNVPYGTSVTLIPNFLYITLSHNYQGAFNSGSNDQMWVRILLTIISWVMSVAIFLYWRKGLPNNDKLMNSTLMLILAGAIGNAVDRTLYWGPYPVKGSIDHDLPYGVIDFIQFYLGGGPSAAYNVVINPFATFNIADSCVTIGIIMLLVILVVREIKENKEKEEEDNKNEGKDNH